MKGKPLQGKRYETIMPLLWSAVQTSKQRTALLFEAGMSEVAKEPMAEAKNGL